MPHRHAKQRASEAGNGPTPVAAPSKGGQMGTTHGEKSPSSLDWRSLPGYDGGSRIDQWAMSDSASTHGPRDPCTLRSTAEHMVSNDKHSGISGSTAALA